MRFGVRRALLPLIVALVFAPALHAQTANGTIDGVVHDPDKAPVPGTTVVVNSPALPQKDLTVVTNQAGYYRVPLLPPGTYQVVYSLTGFQTVQRKGLIVSAGQTTTVDVELALGTVSESVTVTGESPTIDPTSAKLGFNYSQQLLENVPTNRSMLTNILATIPGVENTSPYGFSPGNLEKENVLGAGAYGNRYTMEGSNITDPSVSFNTAALFSPDAIQEVQVIRGAKPAEVGFSSGGFFQIVTKSGGNAFSGIGMLLWQGQQLTASNIDSTLKGFGITQSNLLKSDVDGSANAGGRIVRDKLWFYGSYRADNRVNRLLGFTPDVNDDIRASFGKLTYQLNANHRFTGFASNTKENVNYFFFGYAPALAASPSATMIRDLGGNMAQGHWDGVLTKNLAAQAGFAWNSLRLNQLFQPGAGIGIADAVTGIHSGSPTSGSRISPARNYDYSGSLSWFVPDAAGRHDLKFGGEFTHSPFTWGYDQIGDYTLGTARGLPSTVTIESTPVNAQWLQNYGSFYAQDAWTISAFTLNLGVRYDRVASSLPPQSSGGGAFANTPIAAQFPALNLHSFAAQGLWTWNVVAPRLAVSYRVGGSDKTVLRGSYSRYYHHLNAQEIWSVNPNFPLNVRYRWNDPNGNGLFDLGEQGTLLSVSGGGLTFYDPNIQQPYSDEYTVGISRELFPDFSVNVNYIHRADKRLLSTTSSIPFSAYSPVQVNNPLTNSPMTVYAQSPATLGTGTVLLTNPTQAQFGVDPGRTYNAFEIVASKRLSNRWQMVGSFIASRDEVAIPTSDATGALDTYFLNPNNVIYLRGLDDSNMTYQAKVQGTYMAPYGIVLSAFYRYGSGIPYTAVLPVTGLPQGPFTVFAEPRGARTTDVFNWLDARAEKTFTLPNSRGKIGVFIDGFNLTNASTVFQYGSTVGVNLGRPQAVTNPRSARLGARVEW